MKDSSEYYYFQPRNPQPPNLTLPPEPELVYGTSPLEQSPSFIDTVSPRHPSDPLSCSNLIQNSNDLMSYDPNFSQHLKLGQNSSFQLQDSWQFGLAEGFMVNPHCLNYVSQGDAGNYNLWHGDSPGESLLTGSYVSQHHPPVNSWDFSQLTPYPELSAHDPNGSISSIQFADGQRSLSRPQFPLSNCPDQWTDRMFSNRQSTRFAFSPETSLMSSPSEESNNLQLSPDSTTPSATNIPSDGETGNGKANDTYSRLIYRALQSAPDNKMALRELYRWFEKNTNKIKSSDLKGWQNSIRHNLSMNAAFEGMDNTSSLNGAKRKRTSAWILTKEALRDGVQSTTRYRKPGIHEMPPKSEPPAPQRQISGARGGRAGLRDGAQSTTRCRKPDIHEMSPKSEPPAPQGHRSGARGGRAGLRNGVQSTTKYRKPSIHEMSPKSEPPAPQRQRSGARGAGSRGGRAAKESAKMRRVKREPLQQDVANKIVDVHNYQLQGGDITSFSFEYSQPMFSNQTTGFAPDSFGLEHVIGIYPDSDYHDNHLFSATLFSQGNDFSTHFDDIS
ncbi:hypothetical protein PAAG_06791 [Paracoccidioides lutzii Pb01]|uniref:Fork-head domain-containing protein n=1 Tax=Paracoccidioides lutzii (strain ATCC MYA-826 / Pb01) TaxID=502779 RepID=C1H7Q0_PARBA|nr:hypothetical protein PAAG_06791 [Paracoccidioides lutzii Pb01]EEH36373.2 hypothetical protein PAAG_06791 [Paracoccidioides lutzii Pb01]